MKKAKSKVESSDKQELRRLRSVVRWCSDQDWSYGNHGPNGVAEALRDSLKKKRR